MKNNCVDEMSDKESLTCRLFFSDKGQRNQDNLMTFVVVRMFNKKQESQNENKTVKMQPQQKNREKTILHPKNRNRKNYDLVSMQESLPGLKAYIIQSKGDHFTIDFGSPNAIRMLNKAILKYYYGIDFWEIPKHNLVPPIPGRAEYIHHVADLLENDAEEIDWDGVQIKCLDIGTGASCIYPIIGVVDYNWSFIGSEIDQKSMQSAQKIVANNKILKDKVTLVSQSDPKFMYKGIVQPDHQIDVSICNPPFFKNREEAMRSTRRKVRNLTGKIKQKPTRNFSGSQNELVYQGGEVRFIRNMIIESQKFGQQVLWFTVLISKASNVKRLTDFLKSFRPKEIRRIEFETGNKKSRILAWTFQGAKERSAWWGNK